MFRNHFGIKESPFSNTPDPSYLFMSKRHLEALAHLTYGVRDGSGFVLLTGEVGTGKTTVCRCLIERLPDDLDLAFCVNPPYSEVELLATICDELGVTHGGVAGGVKGLMDALNGYLLEVHAKGRRAVLIIDEAQNLAPQLLEQVRLLTNLETSTTKLLQIILIGQPELRDLLERNEMRQLTQRITARYHLEPLTGPESRNYILHRMRVAGLAGKVFQSDALDEISTLSKGIPRLINSICERCLLGTYAKGEHEVDVETARAAAKEVLGDIPVTGRGTARSLTGAASTAISVAALILLLSLVPYGLSDGVPPSWTAFMDEIRSWPLTTAILDGPAPPAAQDESPETAPAAAPAKEPAPAEPVAVEAEPVQVAEAASIGSPFADDSGDFRAAMASLFTLWHASPPGLNTCSDAKTAGLRCLQKQGAWSALEGLNRPTVIGLLNPSGKREFAVVSSLDGTSVTMEIDGRRINADTSLVTPFWPGDYLVLWKPSAVFRRTLKPGMEGSDVAWLRDRMADIGGPSAATENAEKFDSNLADQVIAFQQSRNLEGDGTVDDLTLIHLNSLAADLVTPVLKSIP